MRTIIDAMGGDLAPEQIVIGAVNAINQDKDIIAVLVGNEDKIKPILSTLEYSKSQIEIIDAKDEITNDESPTMAIKLKKDSSLVKAFDALNSMEDAGGFISAGSTGAVLVGAFMKVGRIKGVSRPALAPLLPTYKGNGVILCDCGANVDCKAINLLHFAIMGSAYARASLSIENPKVGLLSNGAEDHKGNELCHEAFELLKGCEEINFVGNCEARDMLSGDYDVVVSDGFNGNIALKSAEGTANMMLNLIKDGVYGGGLKSKLGALLLKPVFKGIKTKMDYNAHGGACFLGVKKVVVKAHGASKAKSITAAIFQVRDLAKANICEKIKEGVDKIKVEAQEE